MRKTIVNQLKCTLPARSENERLARSLLAVFLADADPTVSELGDLRCALSEAVTNAIVHGYHGRNDGLLYIAFTLYADRSVKMTIRDDGCGIPDIEKARMPLYTTDPDGERSGMGFSVMETFCSRVEVYSQVGRGTKVSLYKTLA